MSSLNHLSKWILVKRQMLKHITGYITGNIIERYCVLKLNASYAVVACQKKNGRSSKIIKMPEVEGTE